MDASGSIPLPPMPLKKTGESIIGAALLDAAGIGQHYAIGPERSPMFVVTLSETQ
jgi:hypothetical protein